MPTHTTQRRRQPLARSARSTTRGRRDVGPGCRSSAPDSTTRPATILPSSTPRRHPRTSLPGQRRVRDLLYFKKPVRYVSLADHQLEQLPADVCDLYSRSTTSASKRASSPTKYAPRSTPSSETSPSASAGSSPLLPHSTPSKPSSLLPPKSPSDRATHPQAHHTRRLRCLRARHPPRLSPRLRSRLERVLSEGLQLSQAAVRLLSSSL